MRKFKGFIAPNCTPTPDELLDYLLPEMTEAELKVTLYIIRRTLGFKKRQDRISLNQFVNGIKTKNGKVLDKGTGLSRTAVKKGLKEGIKRGTIKRLVYCPYCKTEITDKELYEETRTWKNQYSEKTIKVKVAPELCPNCQRHLRGKEKIYYGLNIIGEEVKKGKNKFKGFNPYRYTPIPDVIFDRFLAEIGEAELKVLLYTARRTYGFKKSQERISLNQFVKGITTKTGKVLDKGTGLDKVAVKQGLDKAIERGTIKKLIYCLSCDSQIKEEKLVIKKRVLKNRNGTKHTQVKVVPKLCPICHEKLYGKEKIYYRLNVIEEGGSEKSHTTTASLGGSRNSCPPPVEIVALQGTVNKLQISFNDNGDHKKLQIYTSSNIFDNETSNKEKKSSNAVKNQKRKKDDKSTRRTSNRTQKPKKKKTNTNLNSKKELAKEKEEERYSSYNRNSSSEHPIRESKDNYQKPISEEEQELINSTALDLAEQLNDYKSIAFFKIVTSNCSATMIYKTLSVVKDMSRRGEIRTSKARVFTYLIKREAQEVGISLKGRRKKKNRKPRDWERLSDNPSKLAKELSEKLGDKKGINYYRKIVKTCPVEIIKWVLKEVLIQGKRVRCKGALFNYLISSEMKRWKKRKAKKEKRELSSEEIGEKLDELRKQLDIDQASEVERKQPSLEDEEQPEKQKPEEKKEVNPVLRKKLLKYINDWEYVDNLIQTHSEEELWETAKRFEAEAKKEEVKRPSSEEFREGLTKLRELEQQFNISQDQKVEKKQSSLEGGGSPEKKRLTPEEFKRGLSELREQVAKSKPRWEAKLPSLKKKRQKERPKLKEKKEVDPTLREKLLKGFNDDKKLVDKAIQIFSEDILWQTVEKFEARTEGVKASPD